MNRKIILQVLCGLMVLISIVFIVHIASLGDLSDGITVLGTHVPLKMAEVLFVIYYLICLTIFVKSFFTKGS